MRDRFKLMSIRLASVALSLFFLKRLRNVFLRCPEIYNNPYRGRRIQGKKGRPRAAENRHRTAEPILIYLF